MGGLRTFSRRVEEQVCRRDQFPVGMEFSGRRVALFGGQRLAGAEPGEREPDGSHRGAEPVGGVGGGLGDGTVVGLGRRPARGVLAGVVGGGGCCGHEWGISLEFVGKDRPPRLLTGWWRHWLGKVLGR